MRKKIFRSEIAVAMAVLLVSLLVAGSFLYSYFNKTQSVQLKEELNLVSGIVDEYGEDYLQKLDSDVFRFTLVAQDGTVLFDTKADPAEMGNHLDREEIKEALLNGQGSSARYSPTLAEKNFYEAVKLENGNILRIGVSQVSIGTLAAEMFPSIIAIILTAVMIAFLLSRKMAKSIVKPLYETDLDSPSECDVYEELTPFLKKINKQHKQIKAQMLELKRRSDEFEQITSCMNEGLVILDKNGLILSMNGAARKLFNIQEPSVGKDFMTVDRDETMTEAVIDALNGKQHNFCREQNASEYRFIVNGTESGGKILGVVILCIDITESVFAERNRKEFTANVSHELKTPLQSIIGSAELLENGMVKPEDTKEFIGNIRKEALRLVLLIDDIIRLSQLDEGGKPATEPVDIYEVAGEVLDALTPSADKQKIKLELDGEHCQINSIGRYIYEIIYNLCDNAIRYNKPCGKVTVMLKKSGESVSVQVSDTGIGIPPEHQSRVFERFYRVDKSHSKETGGTGLGLSIVKHAVSYLGGTILLESTVGVGTTVLITFPDSDVNI
ncbi:MAG: ATP-binding protein [Acutalibacteraceae bacterium]